MRKLKVSHRLFKFSDLSKVTEYRKRDAESCLLHPSALLLSQKKGCTYHRVVMVSDKIRHAGADPAWFLVHIPHSVVLYQIGWKEEPLDLSRNIKNPKVLCHNTMIQEYALFYWEVCPNNLLLIRARVVKFVNIMHCFKGSRFKVICIIISLPLICFQIYFLE